MRFGMLKKMTAALMAAALTLAGCGGASSGSAASNKELAADAIKKANYGNGISCHDPQIILADGTYYMTGSHMVLAKSSDMDAWEYIANGSAKNFISNLYSGDLPAFSYVGKNEEGGYSVWAANIWYNETMGKYCMYFCTSSSYIKSALALAVSDVPEGPYTYVDTFLCSGFSTSEAGMAAVATAISPSIWMITRFSCLPPICMNTPSTPTKLPPITRTRSPFLKSSFEGSR